MRNVLRYQVELASIWLVFLVICFGGSGFNWLVEHQHIMDQITHDITPRFDDRMVYWMWGQGWEYALLYSAIAAMIITLVVFFGWFNAE